MEKRSAGEQDERNTSFALLADAFDSVVEQGLCRY
jgi:hypothetical protein